ncbi:unnamed protein product [Lactuca saligna]|uniref:Uncharacterized protein n=1 Tax=Lactuca saligna TaxID=75948 RepID=A0AA36EHS0_LACSI|nr:unnamed protein product [Lactuca saligna]
MTISFTPKSTFCNKIPPFDKQNFSTCKSKAMKALEFVDFDMLDVISKFPIVVMPKSSNDGASGSKLKGKYVLGYTKKEKRMLNLNVKARIAIRNPLPFLYIGWFKNAQLLKR